MYFDLKIKENLIGNDFVHVFTILNVEYGIRMKSGNKSDQRLG